MKYLLLFLLVPAFAITAWGHPVVDSALVPIFVQNIKYGPADQGNYYCIMSMSSSAFESKKYEHSGNYRKINVPPQQTPGLRPGELPAIFEQVVGAKGFENADTSDKFFQARSKGMYLQYHLDSLVMFNIKINLSNYFVAMQLTGTWEFKDIYQHSRFKWTATACSKQYQYVGEGPHSLYNHAQEDAVREVLSAQFAELMKRKEFTALVNETKNWSPKLDALTISKPGQPVTTSDEALSATVTVFNDNVQGSGCAISNDGYILTNFHVVSGEGKLEVLLDGKRVPCRLVRSNPLRDMALIKAEGNIPFAYALTTPAGYQIGMDIYAIATPTSSELEQTISKTNISGIRKVGDNDEIQTGTKTNSGSVGGALISDKGELLGIIDSKMIGAKYEGIGFGIPAKDFVKDLNLVVK